MLPSNHPRAVISPACRSLKRHRVQHSTASERSSLAATSCAVQRRSYSLLKSRHQCSRSHVPATTNALTHRRHRSMWARDMRSFWHRPDCSWVHSEGDPRTTPRDKDCPACQFESKRPLELSMRELMWERKMELMKNYVEKDPYHALFGRSNERLRNLLGRVDEEWRMPWFGRRRSGLGWWSLGETTDQTYGQSEKNAAPEQLKDTKPIPSEPSISTAPKPETPPSKQPAPVKTTSLTSEDESVFDPITMRRVPKVSLKPLLNNSTAVTDKNIAVDIPVKTFAVSKPNGAKNLTPAIRPDTFASKTAPQSAATPTSFASDDRVASICTPAVEVARESSHESSPGRRVADFWSSAVKPAPPSSKLAQHTGSIASARSSIQDSVNRNGNAKEALEASWIKERESRRKSLQTDVSKAAATKEHDLLQHIDKVNSKVLSSAHFTRSAATHDRAAERKCYLSNHKRDRPFKHMNAHELGDHRASLLAAWSQKHQLQPKAETPAEELLSAEVKAQKAAMRAFENKPRPFGPLRGVAAEEALKTANANTSAAAKSPNEILAEKEKTEDTALAHEIKDIYEKAYGKITAVNQQEAIKTSLKEYERDLPPGEYDFIMGQDSLEQELKNPAEVLKSGYEEPTYYDKSLGASPYSFKMGQDNLEEELKHMATTSKSGYEMPTYYDKRLGDSAYSFKQDNLEQELKAASDATSQAIFGAASEIKMADSYPAVPAAEVEAPKPENPELSNLLSYVRRCSPVTSRGSRQTSGATHVRRNEDAIPVPSYKPSSIDRHLYQIIAWDAKDHSVHTATASSSFCPPTGTTVLPLEAALLRLAKPSRFLPHIEKYQAKGYEIVSANEKLLVMKRIRELDASNDVTHLNSNPGFNATTPREPDSAAELGGRVVGPSARPTPTELPSHRMSDLATRIAKVRAKVHNGQVVLAHASGIVGRAKPKFQRPRSTKLVRKEEPVFSGTQRRWDGATPASTSASGATGGSPPPETSTRLVDNSREQPEQQQHSRNSEGAGSGSDAGSSRPSFMTRAVPRVVGVLGACYITGYLIEYLRDRDGPHGGSGGHAGDARGSHSSHASFAPGLTDRAMWSPSPREDRAKETARKLAAGRDGEGQPQGRDWSRTWAWETKESAKDVAKPEDAEADAVTWVGTALCVVSALGLLSNLFSGGN